jgi:NitT/TauT family transport system permease protein
MAGQAEARLTLEAVAAEVGEKSLAVAPLTEAARSNLSKDLAALLALLFIFITYHIQHPTLLFRVTFGETFRDVRKEGFQEAIAYALLISALVLVGSWFQIWAGRDKPLGRLTMALIAGLALYILYVLVLIVFDSHIFAELYNLDSGAFTDTLQMSRSRARILADPIKVISATALWGGIGLASLVYLWSPWANARAYWAALDEKLPADQLGRVLLQDGVALVALVLWFLTYRVVNPLWLHTSRLGHDLAGQDARLLLCWGLLIVLASLIALQPHLWDSADRRRQQSYNVVAVIATIYILHTIAVLWRDSNYFYGYYHVDPHDYPTLFADSEMLGSDLMIESLKAVDWGALLAGVAFISVIFLWMPWERLDLYTALVRRNLAAIMVALVFLFAWETAVDLFDIQQFLLPKPTAIWETFKESYPGVIAGSWFTFQNAIKGFAYGCGAGILTGVLSARFTRFSKAILPLAIAANAVPIIAFAPISNAWFGFTNPNSKAAIAAVLCYFPAMISTVQGLTSVEATQLELMRSYAAGEMQIFRYLRLPNALPYIFSSFKLAATLSMIGSIVAEFFGGSPATALGFSIKNNAQLLKMTETWSGIIVASLLGIGFYMLVSVLERGSMPWYRSFRSDSR